MLLLKRIWDVYRCRECKKTIKVPWSSEEIARVPDSLLIDLRTLLDERTKMGTHLPGRPLSLATTCSECHVQNRSVSLASFVGMEGDQ